jgi:hypothetical protein
MDRQGFDCGRKELNDWLRQATYQRFGFEASPNNPLLLFFPARVTGLRP